MNNFPTSPVKLDKPGQGLPFLEGFLLKNIIGPTISRWGGWEENLYRFEAEGEKILSLVNQYPELLNSPILVPRLRGLEDSSRFWSMAMTLDHLMIVGNGIGRTVILLSENKTPPIKADIAAVKPEAKVRAEDLIQTYQEFTRAWGKSVLSRVRDKNSPLTHAHPWFGDFTAKQWFWLMGTHQGIHRRQIEWIVKIGQNKNSQ